MEVTTKPDMIAIYCRAYSDYVGSFDDHGCVSHTTDPTKAQRFDSATEAMRAIVAALRTHVHARRNGFDESKHFLWRINEIELVRLDVEVVNGGVV
jgi:hypothetical protein